MSAVGRCWVLAKIMNCRRERSRAEVRAPGANVTWARPRGRRRSTRLSRRHAVEVQSTRPDRGKRQHGGRLGPVPRPAPLISGGGVERAVRLPALCGLGMLFGGFLRTRSRGGQGAGRGHLGMGGLCGSGLRRGAGRVRLCCAGAHRPSVCCRCEHSNECDIPTTVRAAQRRESEAA